jgi:hypothetical protein
VSPERGNEVLLEVVENGWFFGTGFSLLIAGRTAFFRDLEGVEGVAALVLNLYQAEMVFWFRLGQRGSRGEGDIEL